MTRFYWIAAIGLTAFAWAVSVWFYPSLPQRIPTHWNIHGQVDGHGDKLWAVFLMPALTMLMLVVFALLPALSPKKFEVDAFRPTYLFIMLGVVALFVYMQTVILLATWREVGGGPKRIDLGRTLLGGIFVFFALMGGVVGKTRKNFYIGVRVPWTLASDRVWNDTHRLAAWTMVSGGVAGLLVVLTGAPLPWAFAALAVSLLVPVVYSFIRYKTLERRGAL